MKSASWNFLLCKYSLSRYNNIGDFTGLQGVYWPTSSSHFLPQSQWLHAKLDCYDLDTVAQATRTRKYDEIRTENPGQLCKAFSSPALKSWNVALCEFWPALFWIRVIRNDTSVGSSFMMLFVYLPKMAHGHLSVLGYPAKVVLSRRISDLNRHKASRKLRK